MPVRKYIHILIHLCVVVSMYVIKQWPCGIVAITWRKVVVIYIKATLKFQKLGVGLQQPNFFSMFVCVFVRYCFITNKYQPINDYTTEQLTVI